MHVSIRPASLVRTLVVMLLLLFMAHLLVLVLMLKLGVDGLERQALLRGFVNLFDVGQEMNFPTMFSTGLWALSALFLAVLGAECRWRQESGWRYWFGLAFCFLFLCVDETVSIHERLTPLLREMLGTRGFLYYAWVIPYGLALLAGAYLYRSFILGLPSGFRRRALLALAIFITGSIGAELLGGYTHGDRSLGTLLLITAEEFLELSGLIVFVAALASYAAERMESVEVRFTRPSSR